MGGPEVEGAIPSGVVAVTQVPVGGFLSRSGAGVQNHLGAAEKRDGLAGRLGGDDGVPDLGLAAAMHQLGLARHAALAHGSQEVGLQFNGREAVGAFGQGDHATIAAGAVGQGCAAAWKKDPLSGVIGA